MSTKKKFTALKRKLPFQYARLISQKLTGVSNTQVRLVFRGDITDPEIVCKVEAQAMKLLKLLTRNKRVRKTKKAAQKKLRLKSDFSHQLIQADNEPTSPYPANTNE